MFYEERLGGTWHRIEINGEMLMGRAHHVIYFPPPEAWQDFPEWARHRREEIIARIKSEFREPDYEYATDVTTGRSVVPPPQAPEFPRISNERVTATQWAAMIVVIVFFLGVALWLGWIAKGGLESQRVPFPSPKTTLRRVVVRSEEPATYWFSLGIYALGGACALGGAAWFSWHCSALSGPCCSGMPTGFT